MRKKITFGVPSLLMHTFVTDTTDMNTTHINTTPPVVDLPGACEACCPLRGGGRRGKRGKMGQKLRKGRRVCLQSSPFSSATRPVAAHRRARIDSLNGCFKFPFHFFVPPTHTLENCCLPTFLSHQLLTQRLFSSYFLVAYDSTVVFSPLSCSPIDSLNGCFSPLSC
jgi:hypothetical protein